MTRKEWAALAVVLGTVVTLQILSDGGSEQHDETGSTLDAGPHADHASETVVEPAESGSFRTVSLEVRGMT